MYNLTEYKRHPFDNRIVCFIYGYYHAITIDRYNEAYFMQYYDSADQTYRMYHKLAYSLRDCHHYIKSDIIPNLCKP